MCFIGFESCSHCIRVIIYVYRVACYLLTFVAVRLSYIVLYGPYIYTLLTNFARLTQKRVKIFILTVNNYYFFIM